MALVFFFIYFKLQREEEKNAASLVDGHILD